MKGVLKILLLVCAVTLAAAKHPKSPYVTSCSEGHYNFKGVCFQCTPCGDFMYEQEKCTTTSNTVCGWCGKTPNFDSFSDEVLASYQTKCLMSSLNFIGMTKLKDELVNVFDDGKSSDDDDEELAIGNIIIDEDTLKIIDTNKQSHYFNIAKQSLDHVDDSQEDKGLSTSNEEEEEESSEESQQKTKNKENKEEEEEEEESSVEREEETDTRISVADRVRAYLIQKSKKVELTEDLKTDRLLIVPREEVDEIYNNLNVPLLPVAKQDTEQDYGSSEESNERDIKWDKWVDDEVRPLGRNVEIVEAEEVLRRYQDYVKVPQRMATEEELIEIGRLPQRAVAHGNVPTLIRSITPILFVCLGFILIITACTIAFIPMRAEKKPFLGVPTDSKDYHMIIDASKHIENLKNKEKQASLHVHVNPVFDV